MPLAVFALVASPLLAFLAVLLGHRTTRRGAMELDRWRKREETMRILRWATELAVDPDVRRRLVGVEVVGALSRAPLLDEEDELLVTAVFSAVAKLP
jgi:hypothetical protein